MQKFTMYCCVGLLLTPTAGIGGQSVSRNATKVNVVNTEEQPVPVQIIHQKTPYQGAMSFIRMIDDDPTITPLDPAPAADMILTIENISGFCQASEEAKMFTPKVRTTFQGKEVTHHMIPVLLSTPTNTDYRIMNYAFNHTTTIFADTNEPIDPFAGSVYIGDDEPFLSCSFTVSGFLENPNN